MASVFQQLSVVKTLNGTNYDDWYESLNMYLIISKEDLAIRNPKPADLTAGSSAADRAYHKQWYDSNRICLTVIKYTIEKTIRQSIPEKDTAVEYLKVVGEKFKKFDKTQKTYYLSLLDNTHYDRVSSVREHMMKLVNYFNKLKSLNVDLGKRYLVYKGLQSLPAEYGVLRTTYNSQGAEWTIDQITSIVTQEEESLKKSNSRGYSVNYVSQASSSKTGNEKLKRKKSEGKPSGKRFFEIKKNNKKNKGQKNRFLCYLLSLSLS